MSSSMAGNRTYREEALGKRVKILFNVGGGGTEYYPGTIRKLKVVTELQGQCIKVTAQHYIEFDDDEKHWYDLVEEEREDRLKWMEEDVGDRKRSSSSLPVPKEGPERKKSRQGAAIKRTPSASATRLEEQSTAPIKDSTVATSRKSANAPVKKDEDDTNIGAAAPRSDSDASIDGESDLELEEIPKSIDQIIRYMDQLEPDKNYFGRQADSRNGCSKTRKKLRKFAEKNPSHVAVAHWKNTNNWQPPNRRVLKELTALLKTMIK